MSIVPADPLDRPVWHALRTRHAAFAEGGERAKRYATDVSPFAASVDDAPESLAALGGIVPADGTVILLQADACPPVPGTIVAMAAPGVQMVADRIEPLTGHPDVVALGEADAAEMLALASLTRPGPFLPRTHRLGSFIGIRVDGSLAAMAGERLMLPGHTEVSGVCTHPGFRGRGYAGLLSRIVATRIMARGEVPFLHAWAANAPAIRLYESLGFAHRRSIAVTALQRG